jgi:hypothetical protein
MDKSQRKGKEGRYPTYQLNTINSTTKARVTPVACRQKFSCCPRTNDNRAQGKKLSVISKQMALTLAKRAKVNVVQELRL